MCTKVYIWTLTWVIRVTFLPCTLNGKKARWFPWKRFLQIHDEAVESLRIWFHTYLAKDLSRVLNQYHLWLEMRILSSLNKPFIQTTNALSAEHLTHLAWQKALHRCFPAISFLHCGYCSSSNLRIIRTQINQSLSLKFSVYSLTI